MPIMPNEDIAIQALPLAENPVVPPAQALPPAENTVAPPGQLWVCLACGKIAQDKVGIVGFHSPGWDVSCCVNSLLVHEQKTHDGKWVPVHKK